VKEIRGVFDVYGIAVDYRHLSLIADFMTFNGEYKPFNRIGMEESSSPFLKMSFETTAQYLTSACLFQERDDNSTPSSALVLGQVPKIGTGYDFELMHE
jgi:DNA-directed RNA polymerase I subunit RPA1